MKKLIPAIDGVVITEREIKIVSLLSSGKRATEIGVEIGKSSRTVESLLDKLRIKTDAKTLPELVAIFFRNKLIE